MLDVNLYDELPIDLSQPGHQAASVPLRVQLCEDKLLLTVTPGADLLGVTEARKVVTAVCRHLERHQILHRVASQAAADSRPETVIIPLPRRC
jgi:hypothetical protein